MVSKLQKLNLKNYIRDIRLRAAYRIFPITGAGVVANRIIWRCNTPTLEVEFVIRKKAECDGVSYEEMVRTLDLFIGRKTSDEEWKNILAWRQDAPP